MTRRALAAILVVAILPACSDPGPETVAQALVQTDSARLQVEGGSVWYRVTGTGTGTPVILLHGGPGMTSHYLKAMERLGDDRPVIRFDQLGSGKSDATTDTALFRVERFVEQLDALREHLGVEQFHLYGHSWGTMLGMEYYRAHPDRVASLVLASACLDAREWDRHAHELVATLPDSMVRAVELREAEGNFQAADYQAALNEFYARYVFRRPVQADLDSVFATANMAIYEYMWGPSEFTATGTLRDFDVTPLLPTLDLPVLFTVGEFDEAGPEVIARHAAMTPGAQYVVIPGAAHITAWDNPDADVEAVRAFLRGVDGSPSVPDTGGVAAAASALAADPANVERILELGLAQAGVRQYHEAIATFTRGLDLDPDNALLLRWRGHRHLSIRSFEDARTDLERCLELDAKLYGCWYHLGIVRYVTGDFEGAADAFARGLPLAPDAGEHAGSIDWGWMSLARAGHTDDASAWLLANSDSIPITNAYTRRLQLYRGLVAPDELITAQDAGVERATLEYGLGNWYLLHGDTTLARAAFERATTEADGRPAFGFIASEAELRRLSGS